LPVPQNSPRHDRPVQAVLADVSAESAAYTIAPWSGVIHYCATVLQSAISGADATVTVTINGTAIGEITIAHDGSGGGDVDEYFHPLGHAVNHGDYISFESDGASNTSAALQCVAVIRRATGG
jgi:hypothetical protein